MNSRNLMPVQRQAIKRRRRALHRWLIIDGVYLLILGAIGTACAAALFNRDGQIDANKPAMNAGQTPTDISALTQETALLRTHLQSVQEMTDRPDWSILLAALSQTLGDEVVLNGVDCMGGANGTGQSASTVQGTHDFFIITGIGQSQNSVTQFVLAVENLHFFTKVRLVQTAPQTLCGRDCVGFELVCTVPDHVKGAN